ncbi:ABC transporter substrate binding protein [Variovorax ureilyticus]|uniref:ABC transporter substrate binding protein n=1 Tax=Variovorax ureilyticus TaxID=1836198 RepID=A0ABU8VQB9_9BURK
MTKNQGVRLGVPVTPAIMALPESERKFRSELARRGLVEGSNLTVVFQIPDERGRFTAAARELVAAGVGVIVAMGGSLSALAAKQATSTIPIVMMSASDQVGDGLVTSLARPGGNVTGNCTFGVELVLKRLQLLTQVMTRPKAIAYLRGFPGFSPRYEDYEQP